MKQPEALRLADALDNADSNFYAESSLWFDRKLCDATGDAAAELRRQHAELERKDKLIAELVEALNSFVYEFGDKANSATVQAARAALSKAKEQ